MTRTKFPGGAWATMPGFAILSRYALSLQPKGAHPFCGKPRCRDHRPRPAFQRLRRGIDFPRLCGRAGCRRGLIWFGLWLALAGNACAGSGDVFLWRDERGRAHYSDRPAAGARRLKITPPAAAIGDARVARVFDGDTIQMEGGEKVRLLGINTPELGGGRKAAEAGGEEARAWLAGKIAGRRVRLEQDTTPRDKYHRLLAHVFLPDGTHINLALVRQGLATTDIYPPDLKYVEALVAAEREAERAKRGLWALPAYRPKPVESLLEQTPSGWQRVLGTPVEASHGKRYARLRFRRPVEIRIPNANLELFPPLERYLGHTLEVRGWVSRRGSQYAVTVRHPSALVQR